MANLVKLKILMAKRSLRVTSLFLPPVNMVVGKECFYRCVSVFSAVHTGWNEICIYMCICIYRYATWLAVS